MLVDSIRTVLLATVLREKMFFGNGGMAGGGAGATVGEGPATQGSSPKMLSVCRQAVEPFHGCIIDTGLTLSRLHETRNDCYTASNFTFLFSLAYSAMNIEEEVQGSLESWARMPTCHINNASADRFLSLLSLPSRERW